MTESDNSSFGRWLRQRRLAQGMTQKALAQTVGCAIITLQKLESGKRKASAQMAERLAAALGVAADESADFVTFARGRGHELLPPSSRHNVPHPLTPLHGRERELSLVVSRLRLGWRLTTLIGPPGIGKTRLAVEAAHSLLRDYADGVCFVALENVVDAGMVVPVIGQALALQTVGDRPLLAQLIARLRDRHLLLVLDGFEQVLPAADAMATLLAQCPWLSLLVTSREPLHLNGEAQVELAPLAVPDDHTPPADLLQFASTALFIERAIAVQADFAVTSENAAILAQLCRRLDGLPLAIELAAGQIKLLPPAQLLAQLEAHADWLLSLGERRAPSQRQVTLGTAINASFSLLTPDERNTLTALAVFVEGFTLAAAESVTGREGATLATLGALRNKSLLRMATASDAGPRFGMLSAVREFALEHLAREGRQEETRRRHATYFLALAETGAAQLHGADQVAWLQRLLLELADCRAALHWLLDSGDLEAAVRLVVALGPLWITCSLLREGRQAMAKVDAVLAETEAELPLHLAVQLDNMRGSLAYYEGDVLAAHTSFHQALAVAQAIDERREMAYALDGLAAMAVAQGEYGEAWALSERSLALSRAVGDRWLAAITLINLGEIAHYQYDLVASDGFFKESLSILREIGDRSFMAVALHNLGQVAFEWGNMDQAANYQQESLALAQAVMNYRLIARILERMAEIALARRRPVDAANLLGAAKELRRTHGIMLQLAEHVACAAVIEGTQCALGAAAYATALAAGCNLTLRESVQLALDVS